MEPEWLLREVAYCFFDIKGDYGKNRLSLTVVQKFYECIRRGDELELRRRATSPARAKDESVHAKRKRHTGFGA